MQKTDRTAVLIQLALNDRLLASGHISQKRHELVRVKLLSRLTDQQP